MNSIPQLSPAGWGGSSPLSLVRDATVHFRTEKNPMKFGFLALLVCHKGCLWWDCRLLPECPELRWFHPFLSLLYCRNPESSTGEELWMPRGCKGMSEQLEAAIGTGWLGWRAGIEKETREKLQNSSAEVWDSQRTPGGGCPILVFTSPGKGTSGNALSGQNKCSNGMSSEGSRKQSRVKQNTKK